MKIPKRKDCDCPYHEPGANVMHFAPCCDESDEVTQAQNEVAATMPGMMPAPVDLIRVAFESAAHEHYMTQYTVACTNDPAANALPPMPKEYFVARESNGIYMMAGIDAAWWAWQAAIVWSKRNIPHVAETIIDKGHTKEYVRFFEESPIDLAAPPAAQPETCVHCGKVFPVQSSTNALKPLNVMVDVVQNIARYLYAIEYTDKPELHEASASIQREMIDRALSVRIIDPDAERKAYEWLMRMARQPL